MLEGVLYFALGFLSAALLAVMVAPAIWRRAVVLTRKRIESSVPLTLNEIQADKDQLRAEFAMSTRRLEISLEELKNKAADQMIEVNRKRDEMADLADEFQQKSETVTELEAKGSELRTELRIQEDNLAQTREALRAAEERLEMRAVELEKLERRYRQSSADADGRKIELVARETELENLKDQYDDVGRDAQDAANTVSNLKSEIKTLKTASRQDNRKVLDVEKRLARLQSTLADREEKLERRERDLARKREDAVARTSEMNDLKKQMAKADSARLKLEAELAKSTLRMEALLRDASGENIESAMAAFDDDRRKLMKKLDQAEGDRETLKTRLASLETARGDDWETERRENAVLRERINDLAAQVTAMTASLEGNGSVINEILELGAPANGKAANRKTAAKGDAPASLADRIRAVQTASEKAVVGT